MSGTLFVVATPIGNLEDLTFRALRTLREVDLIAAEDTRRTAKLLAHYQIQKSMVSLREHNEAREAGRLVARLLAGENIALVTDAGTPGISDPGARLVHEARKALVPIVPIPGANAIATALSASGLSGDRFTFWGFPPSSGTARREWLEEVGRTEVIGVFFEAPHRIRRTLTDLLPNLVNRPLIVFREITKFNEQCVICLNMADIGLIKELGEFTVAVSPSLPVQDPERTEDQQREAYDMFCQLTNGSPVERDLAIELVAARLKMSVTLAKKIVKKQTILVKRQNEDGGHQRRSP